jgi:hypothetical protein
MRVVRAKIAPVGSAGKAASAELAMDVAGRPACDTARVIAYETVGAGNESRWSKRGSS